MADIIIENAKDLFSELKKLRKNEEKINKGAKESIIDERGKPLGEIEDIRGRGIVLTIFSDMPIRYIGKYCSPEMIKNIICEYNNLKLSLGFFSRTKTIEFTNSDCNPFLSNLPKKNFTIKCKSKEACGKVYKNLPEKDRNKVLNGNVFFLSGKEKLTLEELNAYLKNGVEGK